MLSLYQVYFQYPNGTTVFNQLNWHLSPGVKVALVGRNGCGKTTLFRLILRELIPGQGEIHLPEKTYLVPQISRISDQLTIGEALGVSKKLRALKAVLQGSSEMHWLEELDNDWNIDDRYAEALKRWELPSFSPETPLHELSGGQKTRVMLAGIDLHDPDLLLLDEPSNHLDEQGRKLLHHFIRETKKTVVIISHDRELLHLAESIHELTPRGIRSYGGNFSFYEQQKEEELLAQQARLKETDKALRKATETARQAAERKNKLDARGKKKQEKAGLPAIVQNTLRNKAEKSTAHLKEVHAQKTTALREELQEIRQALPDMDQMKLHFGNSSLYTGKPLIEARQLQFSYHQIPLWPKPLDLNVVHGERIALKGANGSGKTTLIRLLLDEMAPTAGQISNRARHRLYLDQDYTLLDPELTVYQQTMAWNRAGLQEHELKTRLHRFLFGPDHWDLPCQHLSGGERMRLSLCCLNISQTRPDLMILDEPTNHLDLDSCQILAHALRGYTGTMLVVSHDRYFLEDIGIQREILLKGTCQTG